MSCSTSQAVTQKLGLGIPLKVAIAFLLLKPNLFQGYLTNIGTAYQDDTCDWSFSSQIEAPTLIDGNFLTIDSGTRSCSQANLCLQGYYSYSFYIQFNQNVFVDSLLILNNENDDQMALQMQQAEVLVDSFSSCSQINNSPFYKCGFTGTQISIQVYDVLPSGYFSICQVRAYSLAPNSYKNYVLTSSTKLANGCDKISPLDFPQVKMTTPFCQEYLLGDFPSYYQITFDTQRFIYALLLLESSNDNFNESTNWIVTVGNNANDVTINKNVAQYSNLVNQYGKEIIVKIFAQVVGIFRNDGKNFSLRFFAIFSTATDCTNFKPSVQISSQKIVFGDTIKGKILKNEDCPSWSWCELQQSPKFYQDQDQFFLTYNDYKQASCYSLICYTTNFYDITATQIGSSYTTNLELSLPQTQPIEVGFRFFSTKTGALSQQYPIQGYRISGIKIYKSGNKSEDDVIGVELQFGKTWSNSSCQYPTSQFYGQDKTTNPSLLEFFTPISQQITSITTCGGQNRHLKGFLISLSDGQSVVTQNDLICQQYSPSLEVQGNLIGFAFAEQNGETWFDFLKFSHWEDRCDNIGNFTFIQEISDLVYNIGSATKTTQPFKMQGDECNNQVLFEITYKDSNFNPIGLPKYFTWNQDHTLSVNTQSLTDVGVTTVLVKATRYNKEAFFQFQVIINDQEAQKDSWLTGFTSGGKEVFAVSSRGYMLGLFDMVWYQDSSGWYSYEMNVIFTSQFGGEDINFYMPDHYNGFNFKQAINLQLTKPVIQVNIQTQRNLNGLWNTPLIQFIQQDQSIIDATPLGFQFDAGSVQEDKKIYAISGNLVGFQLTYDQINVIINIMPLYDICGKNSIAITKKIGDQTFNIGDQTLVVQYQTDKDVNCYSDNVNQTVNITKFDQLIPWPKFLQHNQKSRSFTISTSDFVDFGLYQVSVIESIPDYSSIKNQTKSDSFNFKILLKCVIKNLAPVITSQTVTQIKYLIRSGLATYTLPSFSWNPQQCKISLSVVLENLTLGSQKNRFPSFLLYNNQTNILSLRGYNFFENNQSYTFGLKATARMIQGSTIMTDQDNTITNEDYSFTVTTSFKNSPPVFNRDLLTQNIQIGSTTSWYLPNVTDTDGDQIQPLNIESDSLQWLEFNSTTLMFKVNNKKLTKADAGFYHVPIYVSDSYGATSKYFQDIFLFYNETQVNNTQQEQTIDDSGGLSVKITPQMDNYVGFLLQFNQDMNFGARTTILNGLQQNALKVEILAFHGVQSERLRILNGVSNDSTTVTPDIIDKQVNYTWALSFIDYKRLQIKVSISNPYDVSIGNTINKMRLKFLRPDLFQSIEGLKLHALPDTIVQLSAQVPSSDKNKVKSVVKSTSNSVRSSIVIQIFMSVIQSGALSLIWGMVGSLQSIAFLGLLNLKYTGNSNAFKNEIYKLANFQMLPDACMNPWYHFVLKQSTHMDGTLQASFNQRYYQMGYINSNPIYNMQQTFISIFVLCGLIITDFFRRLFGQLPFKVPNCSWGKLNVVKYFFARKLNFIFENLYWNIILRVMIEVYIDFLLACMIRLTTRETDTKYEKFITYFNYVGIILLILFFFVTTYILWHYRNDFDNKSFNKRFEELICNLSTTKQGSFLYLPIFLLERIVLSLVLVLLQDYSVFQVIITVYMSQARLTYLGYVQPFETLFQNFMEVTNSAFVLASSYFLFLFTDFVPDNKIRYQISWFMIATISAFLIFNVLSIGSQSLKQLIVKVRKNYGKKIAKVQHRFKLNLKNYLKKKVKGDQVEESIESQHQMNFKKKEQAISETVKRFGLQDNQTLKLPKSLFMKVNIQDVKDQLCEISSIQDQSISGIKQLEPANEPIEKEVEKIVECESNFPRKKKQEKFLKFFKDHEQIQANLQNQLKIEHQARNKLINQGNIKTQAYMDEKASQETNLTPGINMQNNMLNDYNYDEEEVGVRRKNQELLSQFAQKDIEKKESANLSLLVKNRVNFHIDTKQYQTKQAPKLISVEKLETQKVVNQQEVKNIGDKNKPQIEEKIPPNAISTNQIFLNSQVQQNQTVKDHTQEEFDDEEMFNKRRLVQLQKIQSRKKQSKS